LQCIERILTFWLFSWFSINLNPARVEMFCALRTRRHLARTARPPYPGTPGSIFVSNLHCVSNNHQKVMECVSSLVAIYLSSSFEKRREKRFKVKRWNLAKTLASQSRSWGWHSQPWGHWQWQQLAKAADSSISIGSRTQTRAESKHPVDASAFLTCYRASCLTHDVTRHHYRRVFSWVMWPRMLRATTSLPKQPFAFCIFDSVFLLNDQKEPAAWSLQFNLQCTDDDNRSHRNVCNMSFVSFSFFDFHYKAIQHSRLSCTHRFVINNQNWRFRSRAW